MKVWDAVTGQQTLSLQGHTGYVSSVAFSPDGKHIASGGDDFTVKVWDIDTRKTHIHPDTVTAVAFNHRGTVLASGADKKVRLWNLITGKAKAILDGHSASPTALAFSPDNSLLASAAADQTVILWDMTTLAKRRAIKDAADSVQALAFNDNGTLLATGGSDSKVRLWDTETGAIPAALASHKGVIVCLAFSPGGKMLASGSTDGTVKLWDVPTGKERATLERHPGSVRAWLSRRTAARSQPAAPMPRSDSGTWPAASRLPPSRGMNAATGPSLSAPTAKR